jgi:CubicO group peptidase (beta-lactamase class C family)
MATDVRFRAVAVGVVMLSVGCQDSDRNGPGHIDDLFTQLDQARIEAGIPGLAVGVILNGEVTGLQGFGFADLESSRPVTADTPFNIASVTKPMSAVLALRLEEIGVLDLDDPMSSYRDFREFCADARERGGIFYEDWACDDERITLRHLLSMTSNGELGKDFFYNPPAFSWASRPIAEVGGASFSNLFEQHVFGPAGMLRSARTNRDLPLPEELARDLAVPYHLSTSGPVPSDQPPAQGDGAAGGVISTVRDLALFDQALDSGALIGDASRSALWSPISADVPYGLGWFLGNLDGHRVAWHTGLWDGAYSALYLKVPDQEATLLLLANSDGLKWETQLDEAAIERSPFARAFLSWLNGGR